MTQRQILEALIAKVITATTATNLLRQYVTNDDGSELDTEQLSALISNPEDWLGQEDLGREERLQAQEAIGRGRTFRSQLEEGFRQRGVTPTGITRRALGTRFQPLSAQFDLMAGLGDVEGGAGFGAWIPDRLRPSSEALRALLSRASGLFEPGAIGPVGEGATFDPVRQAQQGFLTDLTRQGQSGLAGQTDQFNLALQGVLQSVPRHLRGAFTDFARRRFDQFITETPDVQFLPDFVKRGFNF